MFKCPERAQNTVYSNSKFEIFPVGIMPPDPLRGGASSTRMIKWFPELTHLQVTKCPAFSSNKYGYLKDAVIKVIAAKTR